MSYELPQADVSVPAVCRMLRTKTAYGAYTSTGEDWRTGASTTAVYWCLSTMGTSGPDEQYAHPQACCEGRPCYQPPLE